MYLTKYIGVEHIVTGTDYGHHGIGSTSGDPSAQLNMVEVLRSQDEYPSGLMDKLLVDNRHALYGL